MTYASGRLGAIKPSAATATAVYTAPASVAGAAAVGIANTSSTADTVSLALSASGAGSPASTDYLLNTVSLPGNTAFQYTGIVATNGQIIYCLSTNGTTTFVATGYEDAQ